MNYKEEIQKLQKEIKSLRSDMEQGKIRIRVCTDPVFRQELAKAIALDYANTPKKGWHYAKPCLGQVCFKEGAFMQPHWNSSSVLVIPVVNFVDSDPNQFSVAEWESLIGKEEVQAVIADWQKAFDPDIDTDTEEVFGFILDWALENPKHSLAIKEADELLQGKLIKKIIPLIKDEILFKIPNDFAFVEKCYF
jgi:hypothetical protein